MKSDEKKADDELVLPGEVTTAKLRKAAEVQAQGSEDILENVEADAVLDSAARAAKEAEQFNHGKNDAGVKK